MEGRVKQVKEENCRNSFVSLVIFNVFCWLTVANSDDYPELYSEYPAAAIWYVGAIFMYGVEMPIQFWAMLKAGLECNVFWCKYGWVYIISSSIWNIWGASIVWGERFKKLPAN